MKLDKNLNKKKRNSKCSFILWDMSAILNFLTFPCVFMDASFPFNFDNRIGMHLL